MCNTHTITAITTTTTTITVLLLLLVLRLPPPLLLTLLSLPLQLLPQLIINHLSPMYCICVGPPLGAPATHKKWIQALKFPKAND